MSGDDSDRSLRGYRAAADALDERPSAATRAAILAAAARQVQATPRDVREPLAAPRIAARRRWPYAAAAAVMLSTLAVMMATRTEREMPTFTAPADRVGENAAATAPSSAPPPPAVAPTAPAVAESAPAFAPPKTEAKAKSRATRSSVAGASSEPKAIGPDAAPRAKEEVDVMRDTAAPAAAPAPQVSAEAAPGTVKPAPLAKRPDAPPSESAERRSNESSDSATAARSTVRQAEAPPSAGLGAAAGGVRTDAEVTTGLAASEWLDRIIKLRRTGRHDEADVELKRFRETYPQVTVPAEALPVTGTR